MAIGDPNQELADQFIVPTGNRAGYEQPVSYESEPEASDAEKLFQPIKLPGAQVVKPLPPSPDWSKVEAPAQVDAIALRRAEALSLSLSELAAPYAATIVHTAQERDRHGLAKKIKPTKSDLSNREVSWSFPEVAAEVNGRQEANDQTPRYQYRIRYTRKEPPVHRKYTKLAKIAGQKPELPRITVNQVILTIILHQESKTYSQELAEQKRQKSWQEKLKRRFAWSRSTRAPGEADPEEVVFNNENSRVVLRVNLGQGEIDRVSLHYRAHDTKEYGSNRLAQRLTQGYLEGDDRYYRKRHPLSTLLLRLQKAGNLTDNYFSSHLLSLIIRPLPYINIEEQIGEREAHTLERRPKAVRFAAYDEYKRAIATEESAFNAQEVQQRLDATDRFYTDALNSLLSLLAPKA